MSFRGRGGGRGGGGRGGGGFRGGRGGRGGGRGGYDQGPPERVVPLGNFSHACQEDLVVKSSIEDVPYFNAPVYLENKQQVNEENKIFSFGLCFLLIIFILTRLVKLTRSSGPSESITYPSNPQMMSRPRVLRLTSSCLLTPPSSCRSQGSCRSLLVLRKWEAGEDAAEAGVVVVVASAEVAEEEASEEEGEAEVSTEGAGEVASEGEGEAEVSEEGVEDKFTCCLFH